MSLIKEDQKFNIKKASREIFDNIKRNYNNKLLWTVSITDTTYRDQFFFSNLVLSSELLKGITDTSKRNNVEINLRTSLQYRNDTLKSGRDLKRSIFSFEPGINFILNFKGTERSFFEIKLSGSYYHIFSTLYKG